MAAEQAGHGRVNNPRVAIRWVIGVRGGPHRVQRHEVVELPVVSDVAVVAITVETADHRAGLTALDKRATDVDEVLRRAVHEGQESPREVDKSDRRPDQQPGSASVDG